MIKFIFFGRLVHEKGVDLILDVFTKAHKEGMTNWYLDIYGVGALESECRRIEKEFPEHVTFHGRGDAHTLNQKLSTTNYCLMPSLIIETFGLTALESLKAGVPVIGFKKGGLEPFITSELNIKEQHGTTNEEKLFSLISHLLTNKKENNNSTFNTQYSTLLENYTPDTRLKNFKSLASDAKRILIVSDFIKKIGGIENYIHDVKDLLQSHGYTVELWGSDKKVSFRGLFKTALNISARRKLRKKTKEFQPDIVRCHSVMRELGRLPLTAIDTSSSRGGAPTGRGGGFVKNQKSQGGKIRMMFHDMGYFVPYPSKLYTIPEVSNTMSLSYRLSLGKTKNPVKILLLTFKRLSLRMIKSVLQKHNTVYLVPSQFMVEPTQKGRAKKEQKIVVLPHFVK